MIELHLKQRMKLGVVPHAYVLGFYKGGLGLRTLKLGSNASVNRGNSIKGIRVEGYQEAGAPTY